MTIAWIARVLSLELLFFFFLRRKTVLTEKIGGHKFCFFVEGCHCVGFRAKMIVFRRSLRIPGDRDDQKRTPERFQSLTIASVFANDSDAIETIGV